MDAKKSSIKDFLSVDNMFFVIPVYQRNFCWQTHQCRKLFDDIYTCMVTGKSHFLGTICYKSEKEENESTNVIIDGQQRITCLSLLLKALYDISNDSELRMKIQNKYLLNPLSDGKMKLKLKPIQKDAGIYKKLLSHYRVDSDAFNSREMSTPLFKAFENFKVWINELKEIDDFEQKLMKTIEKLEVVEIIVTSENPQEIFESLNATGMSLTNTDILRNYLLMTVPYKEQVRLYNNYWLLIEEAVTTEELPNFMCSYLVVIRKSDDISSNGHDYKINPQNICSAFRHQYPNISEIDELENLFKDMYKYSQYYKRLIFEKGNNLTNMSPLDYVLHELFNVLNDSGFKPLILYLFEKLSVGELSRDEMIEIIKIIISFVFRNAVCGNKYTFGYQFSGFLINKLEVYSQNDNYVKAFKKAITSGHGAYAFPSDILFERALTEIPLTLPIAKLKYLLYSIEKEMNPEQQATMSAGSIEHIMPKTLSDSWSKYLAFNGDNGIHEDKLNCLGNLTLTESNSTLSNKLFNDKKVLYEESIYKMTREIVPTQVWTKKAINERSKKLFKYALKIWPGVNVNKSNENNFLKYTLDSDLSRIISSQPTSFSFLGEEVPVSSWTALGCGVVTILYAVIPEEIEKIVELNPEEILGMLSSEADDKKQVAKITDGIWLNQAKKPIQILKQLKVLLKICSGTEHPLKDELWFTVASDDDDDTITMI